MLVSIHYGRDMVAKFNWIFLFFNIGLFVGWIFRFQLFTPTLNIGDIATIFSAGIMWYTVRKMAEQNELSEKSIQEMKRQNEQNEKTEHLRFLYVFINEDVHPVLEKVNQLNVDDYIAILGKYSIIFNNLRFYQGGVYKREKGYSVHSYPREFEEFIAEWSSFAQVLQRKMIDYKDAGMLKHLVEDKPNIKEIFREYLMLCCDLENYLYLDSQDPWADKFTAILNKFSSPINNNQRKSNGRSTKK